MLATYADQTQQEMPKYKSHKEVWALQIEKVEHRFIHFKEAYQPIEESIDYFEKHKPEAGGYYVVYKDGYSSFSPKAAFEEGYSRI